MLIQKTTMKVPEEGEASLPNDLSMKYAFLFIQDPRITKEIATGEDLLKSYVLLSSRDSGEIDDEFLSLVTASDATVRFAHSLLVSCPIDVLRRPGEARRQKPVAKNLGHCVAVNSW